MEGRGTRCRQAMEPKGGTLESRSTMNACLQLLCLYQKTLPSRKGKIHGSQFWAPLTEKLAGYLTFFWEFCKVQIPEDTSRARMVKKQWQQSALMITRILKRRLSALREWLKKKVLSVNGRSVNTTKSLLQSSTARTRLCSAS